MFKVSNPTDFINESLMSGPIPGQVFTTQPKSLPIDRPAEIVDAEQLLSKVLKSFAKPRKRRQIISMLDIGTPVDSLASTILSTMVMEGETSPQAAMVSTPAVMIALIRMADAAGVTPKLSGEDRQEPLDEVDRFLAKAQERGNNEDKVTTVAEQSLQDLPELPNTEKGLMTRPEGLM